MNVRNYLSKLRHYDFGSATMAFEEYVKTLKKAQDATNDKPESKNNPKYVREIINRRGY